MSKQQATKLPVSSTLLLVWTGLKWQLFCSDDVAIAGLDYKAAKLTVSQNFNGCGMNEGQGQWQDMLTSVLVFITVTVV